MCGWPSTSDPSCLISGLRRQPLLAVLRPSSIHQARRQLEQLHQAGLCHAELAVEASSAWVAMARELVADFPSLRLGAASVRSAPDLEAVLAAGLGYAVSPILDRALLKQASVSAITLVPGVFSPTEIVTAVQWGAPAVKLYPAACLGPGYWRSLAGPLGPLPFCIAAGGISAAAATDWYAAGLDAIALGGALFNDDRLDPALQQLVVNLRSKCYP